MLLGLTNKDLDVESANLEKLKWKISNCDYYSSHRKFPIILAIASVTVQLITCANRPPACHGSSTLPDSDMDTNSDSDSKPNSYIVLCRTFHIAWTRSRIPTHYFCTGQESESESVPESVNEPLVRTSPGLAGSGLTLS